MGDQLVAGAILLPLLAALLAYFVPAPAFRRVIVIATGILLAGISIALASYETLEVGLLPIPGVEWPLVLIGADLLLTEMKDEDLLKLVALDLNQALKET